MDAKEAEEVPEWLLDAYPNRRAQGSKPFVQCGPHIELAVVLFDSTLSHNKIMSPPNIEYKERGKTQTDANC